MENLTGIAEQIQDRLYKKFNDPIFGLQTITEDYIIFDYPHYFDREDYNDDIKEEENFLTNEANQIKNNTGKQFYFYIGDSAMRIL